MKKLDDTVLQQIIEILPEDMVLVEKDDGYELMQLNAETMHALNIDEYITYHLRKKSSKLQVLKNSSIAVEK